MALFVLKFSYNNLSNSLLNKILCTFKDFKPIQLTNGPMVDDTKTNWGLGFSQCRMSGIIIRMLNHGRLLRAVYDDDSAFNIHQISFMHIKSYYDALSFENSNKIAKWLQIYFCGSCSVCNMHV